MKKRTPLHLALVLLLTGFIFLPSCKKVNEATLLGGGLVPEVDNINTFEKSFETATDNIALADTNRLVYTDPVALGNITNDPEFGQTNASVYFQITPTSNGTYPFVSKENFVVDSVVLALDYIGGYGDTVTPQTVHVYEVAQTSAFNDTTYYQFNHADFETTGAELGSAMFAMSSFKDSFSIIRKDTVHQANQLRIKLDNAFGERLASYDTTNGVNGGYRNDTLFKALFRGFALKADNGSGNGLAYFQLSNTTKTNLTVYYKATVSGKTDTAAVVFTHVLLRTASAGGQANTIRRQAAGGWATYLGNSDGADDKLYIQSSPGSAGYVTIPALDTFQNKLIHRAEVIATVLPSDGNNFFTPPQNLFVDRLNSTKDTAFLFPEFLTSNTSGGLSFSFANFGGKLQGDNTYRFNITKTVQDVIAGKLQNPTLRIYAPFDTRPFDPVGTPARVFVQAIPSPAYGRVVLAGGNYADANARLRLRIVYSNL